MALHRLLEELQCGALVTGLAGEGFQDLALVIHSPPQILLRAVDFHKHLVEVPAPMGIGPHVIHPLPTDLGREHRSKAVPPETHRLMANVDPALGQQILDVPQRQRLFDVHHHDEADHRRRAVELAERARRLSSGFAAHPRRLPLLGTPCHIRLIAPSDAIPIARRTQPASFKASDQMTTCGPAPPRLSDVLSSRSGSSLNTIKAARCAVDFRNFSAKTARALGADRRD